MTRRKEVYPLERVHVSLYEGDFAKLGDLYPRAGATKVIRLLVHDHVRKIEEAKAQAAPSPKISDEDLDV